MDIEWYCKAIIFQLFDVVFIFGEYLVRLEALCLFYLVDEIPSHRRHTNMKKLDNEHKQQKQSNIDARQMIKKKQLPNCAKNYAEHVQWVKPEHLQGTKRMTITTD